MSSDTATRREFLKKSAAAGAAMAGADLLASTVEAATPAAHRGTSYELTFWDWWSPVGSPALTRWFAWVKKTFEKENPGITLKYQFIPWGDSYLQKVQAAVAAGNPPDVFHCDVVWARELWDRNVLYRMNDLIAKTPEVQPSRFFPTASITDSANGAIFGVPMEGPDSQIIMMNVDLISKALGWPARTPQDLWTWADKIKTWDDFTKLAIALTTRSGKTVKVAGFNTPDLGFLEWTESLLVSNGSQFFNRDLSGVQLTTRQALECVQWSLRLQKEVSQPPNAQRNDEAELIAGHVAMIFDGTWSPSYIHDAKPGFRMMMTPLPRGPHGKSKGTITWNNMVCLPRNVKNPDLSWKFVTFISAERTQLKRLEILDRYAPLRHFFKTPQWKAAILREPELKQVPVAAGVGGTQIFLHYSELYQKVAPFLSQITLGKLTPHEGLARAQKAGDSVMGGGI
jgi:ABC-type glycerol-3-phosphate transport system substrate-binding protein